MTRHTRPLALGFLFAAFALIPLAGCDGGGVSLVVELVTDYQPITEVREVEVRIVGLRASRSFTVEPGTSLQEGVRVVDVQGLDPSAARQVEILLRGPGGAVADERSVLVDNRSSIVARVVMSRRCRGIVCDDGFSCLGERCVPQECTSGLEPSCPEPECRSAADCAPLGGCSRALCAGAVCAYEPAEELCSMGEVCDLDCGCVSEPGAGVALLSPPHGASTGSPHAPGGLARPPLRPLLRWRAEPGADSYQVQMDDSCGLGDLACCSFPSPEVDQMVPGTEMSPGADLPVSTAPPMGAVYLWRVRACSGGECGPWSEVRHLEVGRTPGDYDGDGYAELAVGTRPENAFGPAGEYVYLFEDDGAGTLTTSGVVLTNASGDQEEGFSEGLASGDFNGDGFFDLAVTSPELGLLYVFDGGAGGLDPARSAVLSVGLDTSSELLSSADVSGDGYDDLWIQTSAGFALLLGSPAGLSSSPTLVIGESVFLGQRGMAATADLDGDGYHDLALATGEEVRVYPGGVSPSGTPIYSVAMPSDPDFGATVALGDWNGDGYGDLVVSSGGSYNRGTMEPMPLGRIYAFLGSDMGPDMGALSMVDPVPGSSQQRNGWSVYIADLAASGVPYLIHAASDSRDEDGGAALHLFGGASDVIADPTSGTWDAFGEDITALDLDGDGDLDLILGASNNGRDGAIFRYPIEAGGLGALERIEHPGLPDGGRATGYFGASLAP